MRREKLNVRAVNLDGKDINLRDSKRVLMALHGVINFNVASPYTVSLGKIPAGAEVIESTVQVVTAFNAATTNVLVVGDATTADLFVAAGDVNEGAAGTTVVAKYAALTAEKEVLAKYTQTGGAATTGQARITVKFLL